MKKFLRRNTTNIMAIAFASLIFFLTLSGASDGQAAMRVFHERVESTAVLAQKLLTQVETEVAEPAAFDGIVAEASPAVVLVRTHREVPAPIVEYEIHDGQVFLEVNEGGMSEEVVSSGSGFFISSDGHVITNKHVVLEGAEYVVDTGEEELAAEVVYRAPDQDLAMLKVEGEGFPALSLDDTSEPTVGDIVIAIGNAFGRFVDSSSVGVITDLEEDIVAGDTINGQFVELPALIETTVSVYQGDSGGPLLNEDGEVIGINVATTEGVNVAYAIPAAVMQEVLEAAGIL